MRRFQELNDLSDGDVRLVHGRFEFAVGQEVGVGATAEEVVGQGSAQALVEEHEHECDLCSLVGEAVGVSIVDALDQCMGAQLAQVVAQLVQPVALVGYAEARQDDLMELRGAPAADGGARMQQHLHEANHAGVVDLDAGELGAADRDG